MARRTNRGLRYTAWVGLLVLIALAIDPLMTRIHVAFNFCPLRVARFNQSQLRPVVYGYPTAESLRLAQEGRIVLGGCRPMSPSAFCPYCSFAARFRASDPPAVPLTAKSMEGLTPAERHAVDSYVTRALEIVPSDYGERMTAILVTPTDVWVGTRASGLHRYDRTAGNWEVLWGNDGNGATGECVKRIRLAGSRVYVEHEPVGPGSIFYEDYTPDRGSTWRRP